FRWQRRQHHKRYLHQPRTGAIPGSRLRKGAVGFVPPPPALDTQHLVGLRPSSIPAAAITLRLAAERSSSTMRIPIRPLAPRRFCSTATAQRTAPMEQTRLSITDRACRGRTSTMLSVPLRCLATPADTPITLWAITHFSKILVARQTRP